MLLSLPCYPMSLVLPISWIYWVGETSPSVGDTTPWWDPGLCKWRERPEHQLAFVTLCFLIVDGRWWAAVSSCCLDFRTTMDWTFICESQWSRCPLSCFWQRSFSKQQKKNKQTIKQKTNMDVLLVCHFKFWTHILLHEQSPVHLATHWRTHRLYPVFDYYRLTWYTFMKKFFEYVNFFIIIYLKNVLCPLSHFDSFGKTQCYWCVSW